MQRRLTLFLTALTLPCLAASVAPGDKLAYSPAAGSTLVRSWTIVNNASLDDLQISSGGQPMPMPAEMEMSQSMTTEIQVTDHIVALREGAPKSLKRTFDTLAGDGNVSMSMPQMGDNSSEMTAKSELEGKTVQFVWNEEESEFEVKFDGGEGDEELLGKLDEDMDLRAFLPKSEVAAGDTWEPSPNALRAMIAPGGGLALIPEAPDGGMQGMGPGMDRMGDLSSMMRGDFEGSVTAEYKGIRDVDGAKLGEIHLTFEISTAMDLTDEVGELSDELPEGVGSMEVDHLDVELSWKGEATVLWDVAAGHVASAEAHGDITTRMDSGMSLSVGGRDMNIETTFEMSGKVDSKLTVTRE